MIRRASQPPTSRPAIFVRRSARLVARLQLAIYAWRFARVVDARVVVLWPPLPEGFVEREGPYAPGLIFDLQRFYGDGGAEELVFLEGPVRPLPAHRSLEDPEFSQAWRKGFAAGDLCGDPRPFLSLRPILARAAGEPADFSHFRQSLRETYALLPHHPVITEAVAGIRARIGTDDYLGLHVRRGDVNEAIAREMPALLNGNLTSERLASLLKAFVGRSAPDEAYYPAIEAAIAAKRRIVFFSDTPASIKPLAARFGPGQFVDATRFAASRPPMQKAFIDFNLLVQARSVVSTDSIFGSFAAMLGAGEYVNVAGFETTEETENRLDQLIAPELRADAGAMHAIHAELRRQIAALEQQRRRDATEAGLTMPQK